MTRRRVRIRPTDGEVKPDPLVFGRSRRKGETLRIRQEWHFDQEQTKRIAFELLCMLPALHVAHVVLALIENPTVAAAVEQLRAARAKAGGAE